jgi:hypothetical protein
MGRVARVVRRRVVGLYKLNTVYPWLESVLLYYKRFSASAWFHPLRL